ncbi:hypothetical protein DRO29_05090 [Candidatus Bathyarchaeota archaeon]|nr:MAG: hypothetical protein DRO29_05090 [Candidatus Bathyarchaeota archaeon]
MVEIVEQWADFEFVADRHRYGAYQVIDMVDGVEVRVLVGRYGYVNTFEREGDPLLERILAYCRARGFIKLRGSVPDHLFFKAPKEI